MKKTLLLLTIIGLSTSLMADPYAKCIGCHGINGENMPTGAKRTLASMNKEKIASSLYAFKNGSWGGKTKNRWFYMMRAQVVNLTDNDIQIISDQVGK